MSVVATCGDRSVGRIALAQTGCELATVCDFAHHLRVVDAVGTNWHEAGSVLLPVQMLAEQLVHSIRAIGVEVLMCGDCSRRLVSALAPTGLRVVTCCRGDASLALSAWLNQRRPAAGTMLPRRRCRVVSSLPDSVPRRPCPVLIAIAVTQPNRDADLDPRFGRARHFCVWDPTTTTPSFFDNPSNERQQGAGLHTASFVLELGVEAVIAGEFGPKAAQVLKEANCPAYATTTRTLASVMEAWRSGAIQADA